MDESEYQVKETDEEVANQHLPKDISNDSSLSSDEPDRTEESQRINEEQPIYTDQTHVIETTDELQRLQDQPLNNAEPTEGIESQLGLKTTKQKRSTKDTVSQADGMLSPDESFMAISPEEQESWNKVMEARKREISQRKDAFEMWVDKIKRRRMFAYSKMKRIEKISRERTLYYDEMRKHLHKASSNQTVTTKD